MYYVLSFIEAFIISIFLYAFKKKDSIWIRIFTLLCSLLLFLSISSLLKSDDLLSLLFLIGLLSYGYLYITSHYSNSLKIFIVSIILSSHAVIYQSVFFITYSLFYSDLSVSFYESNIFHIERIIINIIYAFILYIITKQIKRIKDRQDNSFYLLFSTILFFSVFLLDCFELSLYTDEMAKSYTIIILYSFLVFTGALFYWFILFAKNLSKVKEQSREISILKHQQESAEKLLKAQKELFELKHDLKHYINAFNSTTGETKKFFNQLKQLSNIDDVIETGNPLINLILSQAKEKAKNENYDLQCSINLSHEINIDESDLYLLLSNAIDNAFVHNGSHKYIQIIIQETQNYVRIKITNSIDSPVLNEDNEFIHQPLYEHGYGFKTIKNIIEENKGIIHYQQQNNQFTLSMLVPFKIQ